MPSLNKILLIGHLGNDPTTKFLPSGAQVTTFSVATSEKYKNKDGSSREVTEWFNCVAFGKLAEICSQYLSKGSLVYVEGSLRTEKWEDKDGIKRQATKVMAQRLQMLSGRKKEEGGEREPGVDEEEMPF